MPTNQPPRVLQYKQYAGQMPPQFPEGSYLHVDVLDQDCTSNESCWQVWDIISREIQVITARPAALQPEITNDLIASIISAINRSFAALHARVATRANLLFTTTYGGPPQFSYEPYPIRWAAENREALTSAMSFVSALFQIPQVPSNRLDVSIMDNHAGVIAMPLYGLKARIMREWFGIEVKGHISPDELDSIFRKSNLMPPLRFSMGDRHDTDADLAAEDANAMTNESAQMPTAETVQQVKAGVDVWTWVPSQGNWLTFGEIVRRGEITGPVYAPGEPFPFALGGLISGGATSSPATGGPAGLRPQS